MFAGEREEHYFLRRTRKGDERLVFAIDEFLSSLPATFLTSLRSAGQQTMGLP